MSEPWTQAISDLAEWMKISRNFVVPFVGAGVSRSANLPTWRGLADSILESTYGFKLAAQSELENFRLSNPLEILTFCRERLGDEMFRRQVTTVLSVPRDLVAPEVARLCWRINSDLLVTTNLDDVLERAASAIDGTAAQSLTPLDSLHSSLQAPSRRVLHLHGTTPRFETWIMTERDYERAVSPASPVGAALQALLLDRILLFIGYSCNDPDLNLFLERYRDSFPKGSTLHYALVTDLNNSDRKRLLDYGIFPVEYTPSNNGHPEVCEFLEKVCSAFDPKKAEAWADEKNKQPTLTMLSSVSELREMTLGARRDKLNQEFVHLFEQATSYALTGASDLPPIIRQRRAETLEFLAGAWQVDTIPPLNALDGKEVVREIGRGGFGVVWLVRDVITHEQQALKISHFQETTNFKFIERFKQGTRAMRKLTLHGVRNTTKYIAHREVPLCVFMEYIDGGDLAQLVKNVPLPTSTRLRLCRDIANIVTAAHSIPVYHRDLKPSNVLVRWDQDGEPQAVLSDFDLAWFEGAISKTTTRIGDQAFASPEQLRESQRSSHARAESDVYSLGMLFLFIISGSMPSTGQWYNQNLHQEVYDVAEQVCDWLVSARHIAKLITRCAEETPTSRPGAQEVTSELDMLFRLESTQLAEGGFFIEEVRERIAKERLASSTELVHGFHVEQRRDSGRVVAQATYMRELSISDDRGRFRHQGETDVRRLREILQEYGWSVQSQSTTAVEAKLVVKIELREFSLATTKRIATQLVEGLDFWSRRA